MTDDIVKAYGVLDMDGDALHSVHIFKEDAERAKVGLGTVCTLIPADDKLLELLTYEAPDLTEGDGYLLEAAMQANAVMLNDDGTVYAFKQEDLLRLMKCALNKDFLPLWSQKTDNAMDVFASLILRDECEQSKGGA